MKQHSFAFCLCLLVAACLGLFFLTGCDNAKLDSIISDIKAAASDNAIQSALKTWITTELKDKAEPAVRKELVSYLDAKVAAGKITADEETKILEYYDKLAADALAEKALKAK